jgi:predicted transcriptional regulator
MSPAQCRAARALLGWTQDDLAAKAEVSGPTIRIFEGEKGRTRPSTVSLLRRALEEAGVHFTERGIELCEPAETQ